MKNIKWLFVLMGMFFLTYIVFLCSKTIFSFLINPRGFQHILWKLGDNRMLLVCIATILFIVFNAFIFNLPYIIKHKKDNKNVPKEKVPVSKKLFSIIKHIMLIVLILAFYVVAITFLFKIESPIESDIPSFVSCYILTVLTPYVFMYFPNKRLAKYAVIISGFVYFIGGHYILESLSHSSSAIRSSLTWVFGLLPWLLISGVIHTSLMISILFNINKEKTTNNTSFTNETESNTENKETPVEKISILGIFKMAIKNCVNPRKAPKRASRKEFWTFALITGILLFAVLVVIKLNRNYSFLPYYACLELLFYIAIFLLSIRRCHDIGIIALPSYLTLFGNIALLVYSRISVPKNLFDIPKISSNINYFQIALWGLYLILFIIMAFPGTSGKNRFGEKPKI